MYNFEEYIERQIKSGYINENGAPLKCPHCDGKNFEDRNEYYDESSLVEFQVWCVDCNKSVGIWAYGDWGVV